ncbi:MAG: cation:proton antiporter, partial [Deltaproteobacteria bacterium]
MSGGPRRAGDADAGGIGVAIDGAGRTGHAGLRMEYPLRGVPELLLGQILLALAVLFLATYLTAAALSKLRIPGILGALLVAMAAHGTPLARLLSEPAVAPVVEFLGNLAVLFLLFFIGLQIDVREMRSSSRDVALLTVLNTVPPFLLGTAAALVTGYGWVVAFVVGLTRMPTAEAVIVPILDEFGLIRTRVGRFIVGTGVLDDVIEVFLIAFVSVWIGERTATSAAAQGLVENEILRIALGAIAFVAAAWIAHRFLLRRLAGWLPRRPRNLVLLSMIVLFGAGG